MGILGELGWLGKIFGAVILVSFVWAMVSIHIEKPSDSKRDEGESER